jgi:hypothetical protein
VLVMGFEEELQNDERIVLDEAKIAFRGKIILTDKRLVIFKPKGFLSSSFVKRDGIPLSDILEACTDTSGSTGNTRMRARSSSKF